MVLTCNSMYHQTLIDPSALLLHDFIPSLDHPALHLLDRINDPNTIGVLHQRAREWFIPIPMFKIILDYDLSYYIMISVFCVALGLEELFVRPFA